MSTENVRSPQPLPDDANWPPLAEDERRHCDDGEGLNDELPPFPMTPPVSWPRVFPGL